MNGCNEMDLRELLRLYKDARPEGSAPEAIADAIVRYVTFLIMDKRN